MKAEHDFGCSKTTVSDLTSNAPSSDGEGEAIGCPYGNIDVHYCTVHSPNTNNGKK